MMFAVEVLPLLSRLDPPTHRPVLLVAPVPPGGGNAACGAVAQDGPWDRGTVGPWDGPRLPGPHDFETYYMILHDFRGFLAA